MASKSSSVYDILNEEDDEDTFTPSNRIVNPFDLLNEDEDDELITEESDLSEDRDKTEVCDDVPSNTNKSHNNQKKKKKNKNKKQNVEGGKSHENEKKQGNTPHKTLNTSNKGNIKDGDDDWESMLEPREGEKEEARDGEWRKKEEEAASLRQQLMLVEAKKLYPNVELRALFGNMGVGGQPNNRGGPVGGVGGIGRGARGDAQRQKNRPQSKVKKNQKRDEAGRNGGQGMTRGAASGKMRNVRLIQMKPSWPPISSDPDGIKMVLLETKKGVEYYGYEWDEGYVRAQRRFGECVESGDPNQLAHLLQSHPYHLDTLLQLHDAFIMTDDKDAALDLLERLIYRFERTWHKQFNPFDNLLNNSTNQLNNNNNLYTPTFSPYSHPQNRSIFLAMLSYIQEVGRKGCSQTALEWIKFLLLLDPSDPLGLLHLFDHFALRRREFQWLMHVYHADVLKSQEMEVLPNVVYSLALSSYFLALEHSNDASSSSSSSSDGGNRSGSMETQLKSSNSSSINPSSAGAHHDASLTTDTFSSVFEKKYTMKDAEERMHEAMMMYPQVVMILMNRMSISSIRLPSSFSPALYPSSSSSNGNGDEYVTIMNQIYGKESSLASQSSNVLDLPYFNLSGQGVDAVWNALMHLYVERNQAMWKSPDGVTWLKQVILSFALTYLSNNPTHLQHRLDFETRVCAYRMMSRDYLNQDMGSEKKMVRHLLLCESNAVIRLLPSDILHHGFHIYSDTELQVLLKSDGSSISNSQNQSQGRQEQGGAAQNIARVLDYLIPWQSNPQQIQNLLNLIGYQVHDPNAQPPQNNDDEDDEEDSM